MKSVYSSLFFVLTLLSGPSFVAAQGLRSDDEELLRTQAQLPTDTDGLVTFLKARAGKWEYPEKLDKLVSQLGSSNFLARNQAARTLTFVGEPAIPVLQKYFHDPDRELAIRAKDCAKVLEKHATEDWTFLVVRTLIARKPPETVDVLLTFLPFAKNSDVQEEIYYGIDKLVRADSSLVPLLSKSLENETPARRAIAAAILGRQGSDKEKNLVRRIASSDPDRLVRLRAAQGLLAAHDTYAIPALISLLRGSSLAISWQAEELLRWGAGIDAPKVIVGAAGEKEQTECHTAWSKWWQEHKQNYRLESNKTNPGGPCLILGWGPNPNGRSWEHRIWTMGSDCVPRYVFPIRGKQFHVVDWLGDDRLFFLTAEEVAEYDIVNQKAASTKVKCRWPYVKYRMLASGVWEVGYLNGGFSYRRGEAQVGPLGSERQNSRYPEWRGFRCVRTSPDGLTLASQYLDSSHPSKQVIKWTNDSGDVRWEAFVNDPVQVTVFNSMVRFGFGSELGRETLDYRLKLLRHEDPILRRYASERLQRFTLNEQAFSQAVIALKDADQAVRENMLHWIAKTPAYCPKVVPHLIPLLEDETLVMRGIWAPFKAMPREVSISVLAKVYKDREAPSARRASAITLLGKHYLSKDATVIGHFKEALGDRDPLVRKHAILSMQLNPVAKEFLNELVSAVGDQDEGVGREAISCLTYLGADAAPAKERLINAAANKTHRLGVVSAFGAISRNDPSIELFLLCVLDGDEDPRVVAAAANSLGRRANENARTIDGLVRTLTKWKDQRGDVVRRNSIEALGQFGPAAKSAVPALMAELNLDGDGVGRNWKLVVLALGRIDLEAQKTAKRLLRPRFEDDGELPRILLD